MGMGAGLVAAGVGPVGSVWAGLKLEVWELEVNVVAPGDDEHLLAPGEFVPWYPHHHDYKNNKTKSQSRAIFKLQTDDVNGHDLL